MGLQQASKANSKITLMEYWRSSGVPMMEHIICNDEIRRWVKVVGNIMDIIRKKQIMWVRYLQRMGDPQKKESLAVVTRRLKKRRKSKRNRNVKIKEAIEVNHLQLNDWNDQKEWREENKQRLLKNRKNMTAYNSIKKLNYQKRIKIKLSLFGKLKL